MAREKVNHFCGSHTFCFGVESSSTTSLKEGNEIPYSGENLVSIKHGKMLAMPIAVVTHLLFASPLFFRAVRRKVGIQ